ncbi:TPA: hypothetical protein NJT28_000066 [Corynebacterium striatum]|uniref:hypothetical protein n=1 Tax=Corynebacterium striatum TaxID=43770 RepID=UPI0027B95322|nr:hypothetical protein [Corynebacterium striatum]HCG2961466.1 hypothetical protein [Corynebacterium striatum]
MVQPGKRRRVVRRAESDYDRTADRPDFVSAFYETWDESGSDATREVALDEEQPVEQPHNEQFYREQIPPHYGT